MAGPLQCLNRVKRLDQTAARDLVRLANRAGFDALRAEIEAKFERSGSPAQTRRDGSA